MIQLVKKSAKWSMSLQSVGAFLFLSHIGRRFPKEPNEFSIRIAFASISLCGFFLITLYRAMLSASLAIKIFEHPVQSLEDILESEHNLLVEEGTALHKMFVDGNSNSVHGKIRDSGKLIVKPNQIEVYKSLRTGKFLTA